MPTLLQIEANRRNAQKSTGPRSVEGKAVSRFNALKTGIDAQSQVIRGEVPAALDALTNEYHNRFQPDTPELRALVDTLVFNDWLKRRLRVAEAQLWENEAQEVWHPKEDLPLGQAFSRSSNDFVRLQRRMDAVDRTYLRTLDAIEHAQADHPSAPPSRARQQAAPDPTEPRAGHPLGPTGPLHLQPPQPHPPAIGFVPHDPLPAAGHLPEAAAAPQSMSLVSRRRPAIGFVPPQPAVFPRFAAASPPRQA